MSRKAYAKVNLNLRVRGRNPDGTHNLESLVAFANYADTLSCTTADTTKFTCTDTALATADNLVMQAHRALKKEAEKEAGENLLHNRYCHLHLEKNIPIAAGLGGGSADAAAALHLLADYFDLPTHNLPKIAAQLGADVPVCLASSPAWITGVGADVVRPLRLPEADIVLVNPQIALATKAVFENLNMAEGLLPPKNPPAGFDNLAALCAYLNQQGNDLTKSAIALVPEIATCLETLLSGGANYAAMSGSGATCFALVASGRGQALAEYYRDVMGAVMGAKHWCVATHLLV
ncbi:MAG: 4-(cytidine 5'-diphospho)-2-C-methyl-D-erythritol kinase [Alphaproteobacteria bacterium]|nr:4-(cytidine 5'-diphospho)-2-C-methyl-D-erythritol kinase [Alphaproteobacteria bacterium]